MHRLSGKLFHTSQKMLRQLFIISGCRHFCQTVKLLPGVVAKSCGFRDVLLLCMILAFLHLQKADPLCILRIADQIQCHLIKDNIDSKNQDQCQEMVANVKGEDPVYMHGLIAFGLDNHIHTGKDQGDRNGGQPPVGDDTGICQICCGVHPGVNGNGNICGKRHQCNVKKIDGEILAYRYCRHLVIAQIQYRHYREKYVIYGNPGHCHDPSAEKNQESQRQNCQYCKL